MKKNRRAADKIQRPIGAKLIIIITILLLLSLGAITILVSVMVTEDVRITAEDNNLSVNRRSASEADNFLTMIRGNTYFLLDTINAVGAAMPAAVFAEDFFFEHNRQIAFIGIVQNVGDSFQLIYTLTNEAFFLSNELELEDIKDFFTIHRKELERSSHGETLLINAAPVFDLPVLAMFSPRHNISLAGSRPNVAVVFFSSNSLAETFSEGVNLSYIINDAGDYLIHADYDLVRSGENAASGTVSSSFVSMAMESTNQGRQILFTETDEKRYFGAFRKISIGNAVVITTIPYDIVMEGTAATTRRNIYLSGAVLFIAILFVWFFSKTVSVPLKILARAARQIEGGNFELDLKSKAKDEIGFLTRSFQKMSGALNIFGRFTNKDIAVRAMRGEIKPGGLPRHATIFFSDIRDFTAKSESFTNTFRDDASDRIVHWLNNYLTRMVDCVEKSNGVVDKFIGDAVMAHWGTASTAGSPEKDAYNCINTALLMRESLLEMNRGRRKDDVGNPPIVIGCGINSGIVTTGQLGSEQRMEYTVIGDPVNLASRVESLTKTFGADILISESTWNLAGEHFITEELPSVKVKGKEKPVRLFAVINYKDASDGPKTLEQVRKLLDIQSTPNIAGTKSKRKSKTGGGE
ncbi:MAG: HAMP domain-containing protein [Treponema sp.]|jgi:adenylate cyclase|nr:HAMP domain-containing protein [Treponema sp.]